ncbi:MAG: NAD-dependent protein deacetylase [Gammaproteobacteria bacterium]
MDEQVIPEKIANLESAPPAAAHEHAAEPERIADWVVAHRHVVALTGAGVSTESGIPDYRDGQGRWKRKPPVQFRDFVQNPGTRQRYWARSLIGWRFFSGAQPSAAHRALAELEHRGRLQQVITQNVDGLHQRAGSRHVIDLHGRLDRVVCLNCGNEIDRDSFQEPLTALNPGWDQYAARIAPDGDADLDDVDFGNFVVPDCARCGGILKPDVVFFGESVPRERGARALAAVEAADALLAVGSSLMVWSSFRLVRAAAERHIPVAAINCGRTRADDLLAFKWESECGALLAQVAARLAA